jgi:FlaA1/EpsC-like NDP-sugar epimerase
MKPMHIDARPLAAAAFDGLALALAALAAAYLLAVPAPSSSKLDLLFASFVVAIPIQLTVNFAFGIYQGVWRYTSLPDIQRIVFAVLAGTVFTSGALGAAGLDGVFGMREYLLYPLLLASIMSLARMGFRSFREWSLYGRGGEQGTPVVIMGAGDAAVGLVKELSRSHEWRVVGLLDDDEKKHGRLLHGVRVLGGLEDLQRFAQRLKLRHAIIAMPSVRYTVRRRVVEVCKRARVSVMTVPTLNTVATGKGAQPARIRKVAVEDLLKRDSVTLDDASLHELLTGQVVMVTGAGGSIGSELCRQIAAYGPSMLVLYEMNEYAMYKVDEQLREDFPNLPVASLVGDIKNARRVNQVMHQYSPALVFHAAAYKHVPLMEEANAWEAVQNNVFGTYVVARAAIDYGVKKFVFVLHRQGGQPHQRHGRDQAPGGDGVPGPPGREPDAFRDGALRQRAGQRRQRDPQVPGADRQGRPGDRHAPGDGALLHVDPRGRAARAAGGLHGPGRGDLRDGHGRADPHRRPRARHDPPVRALGRRHPHRLHGPAAR